MGSIFLCSLGIINLFLLHYHIIHEEFLLQPNLIINWSLHHILMFSCVQRYISLSFRLQRFILFREVKHQASFLWLIKVILFLFQPVSFCWIYCRLRLVHDVVGSFFAIISDSIDIWKLFRSFLRVLKEMISCKILRVNCRLSVLPGESFEFIRAFLVKFVRIRNLSLEHLIKRPRISLEHIQIKLLTLGVASPQPWSWSFILPNIHKVFNMSYRVFNLMTVSRGLFWCLKRLLIQTTLHKVIL